MKLVIEIITSKKLVNVIYLINRPMHYSKLINKVFQYSDCALRIQLLSHNGKQQEKYMKLF